jgi:methylenetetrahydrofolate dehydrogenase (NADP+)/methenyltetrahydrofolate cyclohydrolase
MSATIIDGKALAASVKESLRSRVGALRAKGVEPCLAVVLVGANPASTCASRKT